MEGNLMEARLLSWVAAECHGELLRGSSASLCTRPCTDSRQIQPGDLFIPLSGDKFDGHTFLSEAVQKGAEAVLVARANQSLAAELPPSVAVIVTDDPRAALGRLAARYRADFHLPIVAIGGSNGKTTTKELLASILRQRFRTLGSEASFNNDVGVPLTLLRLDATHEAAVLEAGTNHPGELMPLLRMMQPRLGVITSIGREHLEFFGDLAGVAQEEGFVAEALPRDGRLFLNGDSEWAEPLARRASCPVVRVGFGAGNDWRAETFRVGEEGVAFTVAAPSAGDSGEYKVRLLGRHQVPNALLALAAGRELGVSPEEARRGLAGCAPPKMRMQLWQAAGVRVLDDSYNANADSMLAALQTLHDLPCSGRRVAVLGDMAELGEHAAAAHREVGRRVGELGVQQLVAVGKFAFQLTVAAKAAGTLNVLEFPDVSSLARVVGSLAQTGDLILLKASRSVGMERVGEALRKGLG